MEVIMNNSVNGNGSGVTPSRSTFTEAVPLSLSSMAYSNNLMLHGITNAPVGILDGVQQVLSHTLLSCINYARQVYPPYNWDFWDICTSQHAWKTTPMTSYNGGHQLNRMKSSSWSAIDDGDIPFALEKMKFGHKYCRNAFIYLKNGLDRDTVSFQDEVGAIQNWQQSNPYILGRVSFLYISTGHLNPREMDGTETEDMPPCILYKVVIEYRSLPASGKETPVLAEELSMLSFGGSIDDDVKNGALASLHDSHAKYVLEIYSVRGKKYKFDLMDSLLSDRRLLPNMVSYPFSKCLCVTVTNHDKTIHVVPDPDSLLGPHNSDKNITASQPKGIQGPQVDDEESHGRPAKILRQQNPLENSNNEKVEQGTKYEEFRHTVMEDAASGIEKERPMEIPTTLSIACSDNFSRGVKREYPKSATNDNNVSRTSGNAHSIEALITTIPASAISTGSTSNHSTTNPSSATSSTKNEIIKINSCAIARINFCLEGEPRWKGNDNDINGNGDDNKTNLPKIDFLSKEVARTFIALNPYPPVTVWAHPSKQALLLDPDFAGKIFVSGRYVMDWNNNRGRAGSHGIALFGMDLHSIPLWHGIIIDYEALKLAYSQLWQELLVDAKVERFHLSRCLLFRLLKGLEPKNDDDEQNDDDNSDSSGNYDNNSTSAKTASNMDEKIPDDQKTTSSSSAQMLNVNIDCLEAQVLGATTHYDRVGIAAKALATRFAIQFGTDAYPCLAHETTWVKKVLPTRRPIVVPQRLITILRRGGYFDVQKTCDLLWFENTRHISESSIVNLSTRTPSVPTTSTTAEIGDCSTIGEPSTAVQDTTTLTFSEMDVVKLAVQKLEYVDCSYVDTTNIKIVTTPVSYNILTADMVCRYNEITDQFYVHEKFFQIDINTFLATSTTANFLNIPLVMCANTTTSTTANILNLPLATSDNTSTVSISATDASIDATPTTPIDSLDIKAFLLAFYISKSHPNGKIFVKHVLSRP